MMRIQLRYNIAPLAFLVLMFFASCRHEVAVGTFTVCTLNVDGLPSSMAMVDVNTDGPGAEYTPVISHYLASRGFDFIGVQENFNYDEELCRYLSIDYNHDEWSGGMDLATLGLKEIQVRSALHSTLHKVISGGVSGVLDGVKLPADGLEGFWRKGDSLLLSERTEWSTAYGKLDHANDALTAKGFRRYELRLACGADVVVYNIHTDASDTPDELSGADLPDRAARLSQWRQLRDHIMQRLDSRPVVVLGDMNSYYARDSVKAAFIDAINSSGRATCGDAWVELTMDGKYLEMSLTPVAVADSVEGWVLNGETLDKILYINPKNGSYRLRPTATLLDRDGYRRPDGRPLGDHFPLSVEFAIVK